jgi:prepilin-type N-terminal cleavage/methylation domain-containing protein
MMTKTLTTSGRRAAGPWDPWRGARRLAGFTLLEMMVVIGLVALMASMALPSIVALFNSGADAQAYNLISAQFTAARAKAVLSSTYAGVHGQMADALNETADPLRQPDAPLRPELANVCFSGLISYYPANYFAPSTPACFDLIPGMSPQRIPGNVAFGYASEMVTAPAGVLRPGTLDATIGDSASSLFEGAAAGNITKFTTFSVIFNPLGAVTRFINGDPIHFNDQSPAFVDADPTYVARFGSKRLWRLANTDYVQDRYGATAITMFDVSEYMAASSKVAYLNENAQLLPLNVHTGQLYRRD